MVERVRLDSTAASPLRISASGTDVNLAEFNTLIFDANQPPLRLWAAGWGIVSGITQTEHAGGKNINLTFFTSGFITPSGLPPIFCCTQRGTDTVGSTRLGTPWFSFNANNTFGGGMGIGVTTGVIEGFNTNWTNIGSGSTPGAEAAVSYVIFKNY